MQVWPAKIEAPIVEMAVRRFEIGGHSITLVNLTLSSYSLELLEILHPWDSHTIHRIED